MKPDKEKCKTGIHIRKGDRGQTSLGNIVVSKTHPRIVALGSVDELNATLGVMMSNSVSCLGMTKSRKLYQDIQEDLFVIGSLIGGVPDLEIENDRIAYIEECIDEVLATLEPLENFIIPGGTVYESVWLHLARAVCRRAERDIVAVQEMDGNVPENVLVYMNRLSDFLFVRARKANNGGKSDVLWSKPLKGV